MVRHFLVSVELFHHHAPVPEQFALRVSQPRLLQDGPCLGVLFLSEFAVHAADPEIHALRALRAALLEHLRRQFVAVGRAFVGVLLNQLAGDHPQLTRLRMPLQRHPTQVLRLRVLPGLALQLDRLLPNLGGLHAAPRALENQPGALDLVRLGLELGGSKRDGLAPLHVLVGVVKHLRSSSFQSIGSKAK